MNKLNIFLTFLLIICNASSVFGLRASAPPNLTHPITEGQITQLNKYLDDVWDITNGRIELNIYTTAPTDAKNGEVWLNSTSNQIQFKIGGTVYSAP